MKELLKNLEDVVQESGHQCIRVKDYYDFSQKLKCMGGSYKGFIMTEELDTFCLLYIDTIKMEIEADQKQRRFIKSTMNISPENRVLIMNSSGEYVKEFTKLTTFKFYMRAFKEYEKYEYEIEQERNASFFTRLKNLFKKR